MTKGLRADKRADGRYSASDLTGEVLWGMTEGWVADAVETLWVPRWMRLRLTANGLMLVPVTRAHRMTSRRIENQIEERLPGWTPVSGFAVVPSREGYKPEPDASALPLDQVRPDESEIDESLPPFVVEVVSLESEGHEYNTTPDHYALRGIPSYLVVDATRSPVCSAT